MVVRSTDPGDSCPDDHNVEMLGIMLGRHVILGVPIGASSALFALQTAAPFPNLSA